MRTLFCSFTNSNISLSFQISRGGGGRHRHPEPALFDDFALSQSGGKDQEDAELEAALAASLDEQVKQLQNGGALADGLETYGVRLQSDSNQKCLILLWTSYELNSSHHSR